MKGYKVFNPDWTCKGVKFEVGKTFEENVKPICCEQGFHFCTKAADCFNYYSFDSKNKVAEVEAIGEVDTVDTEDTKCCTNKIKIIKKISWKEVLELVNLGKDCIGYRNSGNYNSGNRNSGDYNSGNHNSGYRNSGNRNSGDYNSGNRNSGDYNSGNYNSGNRNSGDYNSGNRNSGDYNSGNYNSGYYNSEDYNSGYHNSGNYNSGNHNSGYHNSGYRNSGNYNSGNRNSGNYNSGNYNSGDYNSGDYNSGCFNTEESKIFIFNKISNLTYRDWSRSNAKRILNEMPKNVIKWICVENMTDKEKEEHPECTVTGGFLRQIEKEKEKERQAWWNELSIEQKEVILNVPNFDKEIFKKITGIDVEEVVI